MRKNLWARQASRRYRNPAVAAMALVVCAAANAAGDAAAGEKVGVWSTELLTRERTLP